jgi:TolA-binding protein
MSVEPSRYVQPSVTDARVNRLWENVSQQLGPRRSRGFRWLVLCGALSGAAAAAFLALKAPAGAELAPAVLADAKLETKSDELSVTLADGSQVELGAHSAVQVHGRQSSSVSLALARGQVTCDVTHRAGRKFSVRAGDVEVRVVGTKFSVKASAGPSPRVEVAVLRGVVEIESQRRPGIVARVAAGQVWVQELERAVASAAPATALPPAEPASEAPKHGASGVAPSPAASAGPSARELFEKAAQSRRSGDAAAAAQAYAELLRLHPSDGRASLAAFELGRLRMDRLGDASGAITALERAVALNIGPSFREDALARLVSVYAAQGNFAACSRARDRYLASYPAGVHAAAVSSRCGAR